VTGHRAASRLDLTRRDALGLHGLEAELTEVQFEAALRGAADAALEGLSNFVRLGCSMT
jgi:hypothetical protein